MINENVDKYVIVEADSADDANDIATNLGIHFNGVAEGRDCPCCGDRWSPIQNRDAESEPKIYGKEITESMNVGKKTRKKNVVIHFSDGRKNFYFFDSR